MIDLSIDRNLVVWTKFFFTNRKIQLVINKHDNKEREIKTCILQELPVSLILFLIYISRVFYKLRKNNPAVISLLFVDDLGFIAFGTLVKKFF